MLAKVEQDAPKKGPGRPKGGEKRGGRKKGTPNKFTGDIKAMVLEALDKKGGAKYLQKQADENPVAFMGLLGKILPTQIQGDPDAPLFPKEIKIKIIGAAQ